MSKLVLVNKKAPLDRTLYCLSEDCLANIPAEIILPDKHFVLFLALDARKISNQEIGVAASQLFDKGLAYLCVWGPDCERVHDIFDEVVVTEGWSINPESVVMSTWHENEDLEEALWYFVNCSSPDQAYETTCSAGVAVLVGNNAWYQDVTRWLSDLSALNQIVGLDS